MTTVEDASALIKTPVRSRMLERPRATTGPWSWFTTVDHKKIGILYGGLALVFFLVAGIEALLIRLQLAGPNGTVLTASQYNTIFTMHGNIWGCELLDPSDPSSGRMAARSQTSRSCGRCAMAASGSAAPAAASPPARRRTPAGSTSARSRPGRRTRCRPEAPRRTPSGP